MTTENEIIEGLRKVRESYIIKINSIDQTLAAFGSEAPSDTEYFSRTSRPSKKVTKISEEKLNKLVSQDYNPDWSYPDKIFYFLRKYGKMYISDMTDKIKEMYPESTKEQINLAKVRLGYQALKLTEKGLIESAKHGGNKIQYWLPE
jgi:hypothetical protein